MKTKRMFLGAFLLLLACGLFTAPAEASCFSPEGSSWEANGNVYIKVKNNCTTTEAFTWEVTTHTFGIHGRQTVGTTQTGTQAIKPGKTATVCAKKPTTPGNYCFRFKIKNKDMTKPWDTFLKWVNNIAVASISGGGSFGTFEVGGSGFIENDVVLAAAAANPPDWGLDLSTYYVSAADFPATVDWFIQAPPDAVPGEQVTLTIEGYDATSGDLVGTANIMVTVEEETQPPYEEPVEGAKRAPATGGDDGGENGGDPDVEPEPIEPPSVAFYAANEQNGRPIVGNELLVAWDQNGFLDEDASVTFEFFGENGWELIGTEENRAKDSPLGMALVYWDTSELAGGDYQVRVTITTEAGTGTAERVLTVTKAPFADATAVVTGEEVTFDGSTSFDPDGNIVEWQWQLDDGTVIEGPVVTHTYAEPGSYPVDLTVTDTEGNVDTAYCTVDTYDATFVCDARSCGCKKMDVKGAGENAGMDMYWQPAGSKRTLGGVNTVPSPLTPGSHRLYYNFEVEAELVPGSDPTKCETQQWINRTATYGGGTHDKQYNGQSFPYGSDNYAPDNYVYSGSNTSVLEAGGGTIRWVDGCGLDPIGSGSIAGTGASYKAQFTAMVTGPLGTCKCTFEVVMEVGGNGAVVTAPTLQNESCSP